MGIRGDRQSAGTGSATDRAHGGRTPGAQSRANATYSDAVGGALTEEKLTAFAAAGPETRLRHLAQVPAGRRATLVLSLDPAAQGELAAAALALDPADPVREHIMRTLGAVRMSTAITAADLPPVVAAELLLALPVVLRPSLVLWQVTAGRGELLVELHPSALWVLVEQLSDDQLLRIAETVSIELLATLFQTMNAKQRAHLRSLLPNDKLVELGLVLPAEADDDLERFSNPDAGVGGSIRTPGDTPVSGLGSTMGDELWDNAVARDPELWKNERDITAESFQFLLSKQENVIAQWAASADVPGKTATGWQQILLAIGTLVLGAAIKGVASALSRTVTGISDEGIRILGTAEADSLLWQTAIETGKSAVTSSLSKLQGADSQVEKKLALDAYVAAQTKGFIDAAEAAQAAFIRSAGTSNYARLTVPELQAIYRANQAAGDACAAAIRRELLVGWMNFLADQRRGASFSGAAADALGVPHPAMEDVELDELGNEGTLGLELIGRDSQPLRISRAKALGLGPVLRAQLVGTKVRDWIEGGEGAIDLVLMPKRNDYLLSREDHKAMIEGGGWGDDPDYAAWRQAQHREEVADRRAIDGAIGTDLADRYHAEKQQNPLSAIELGAVNFGVGRSRDGGFTTVDHFPGWREDLSRGYTAGRFFLEELHSVEWLYELVAELPIEAVE